MFRCRPTTSIFIAWPSGWLKSCRAMPTCPLTRRLPKAGSKPSANRTSEAGQQARREQLKPRRRRPTYTATSSDEASHQESGYRWKTQLYKCGDGWTVPAVEFEPTTVTGEQTAVLVADQG